MPAFFSFSGLTFVPWISFATSIDTAIHIKIKAIMMSNDPQSDIESNLRMIVKGSASVCKIGFTKKYFCRLKNLELWFGAPGRI